MMYHLGKLAQMVNAKPTTTWQGLIDIIKCKDQCLICQPNHLLHWPYLASPWRNHKMLLNVQLDPLFLSTSLSLIEYPCSSPNSSLHLQFRDNHQMRTNNGHNVQRNCVMWDRNNLDVNFQRWTKQYYT